MGTQENFGSLFLNDFCPEYYKNITIYQKLISKLIFFSIRKMFSGMPPPLPEKSPVLIYEFDLYYYLHENIY